MSETFDFSQCRTVHHQLSRPLLVVTAEFGSLCCGYLSVDALDRNGDAAAIVSGVDDHPQMLTAIVRAVSKLGEEHGVRVGMTGAEALRRFSQPARQGE